MIWAVLDTNVLVSGFGWEGTPSKIIDHALDGRFMLVTSPALLEELERVLQYPKIQGVFGDPFAVVLLVRAISTIVEPSEHLHLLDDESDNRLLEAALEGHADYVVTGDKLVNASYQDGFRVVTPKEFLDVLERGEP